MNKLILLLVLAMVAGMTAFCVMRWRSGAVHSHPIGLASDAMQELAWLRTELQLSDEQFAKVKELHAAYRPRCGEMHRRISEAHEKIESFAQTHRVITPEYKAALKDHADIHVECQEEMLRHLYATAALLNEDQAQRYLEAMLPFAMDFTHSESGNFHAR